MIAVPSPPPPPPLILTAMVSPVVSKVLPTPRKLRVFATPILVPLELIPIYAVFPASPDWTSNVPVTVKLPSIVCSDELARIESLTLN